MFSPMDDPPLKERPVVEDTDELPEHLRPNEPRAVNPDIDPVQFIIDSLKTPNATEKERLPPDKLLERTFLMPPNEDGTRV